MPLSEPSINVSGLKNSPPPTAVGWLCAFQLLNGFNFTVVQGTPMVLVGKYLGAGEVLIGLLLAFTPFFCVLQLLAARTSERLGHKRMLFTGWRERSAALLLMLPLPLLHGKTVLGWPVADGALLAVLTVMLLLYTAIRSYAFVGWIPWLSQLIPEAQRGRYFGWDQTSLCAGMLASLVAAALFLGNDPMGVPAWKYAVLLGSAWLTFWLGWRCLKPIPCRLPETIDDGKGLGWREFLAASRKIWAHPPFRRMVRWMAINNLAWGAYNGFSAVFMRDKLHLGDGPILGISAISMLGIIATSMFWGRFSDSVGSRPTMRLAGVGQLAVLGTWILCAAGIIELSLVQLFLLNLVFGVVTAAMTVPFLKLYMASFPPAQVTVAATLNTAIASIFAGAAPLLWGIALNGLQQLPPPDSGWLRPYTIFFAVSALLTVCMQLALTHVRGDREIPARQLISMLALEWPRRLLSGVINSISPMGPNR